MSKWDKLITRICNLSRDLRFDELRKVLESCGYEMNAPSIMVQLSRQKSEIFIMN